MWTLLKLQRNVAASWSGGGLPGFEVWAKRKCDMGAVSSASSPASSSSSFYYVRSLVEKIYNKRRSTTIKKFHSFVQFKNLTILSVNKNTTLQKLRRQRRWSQREKNSQSSSDCSVLNTHTYRNKHTLANEYFYALKEYMNFKVRRIPNCGGSPEFDLKCCFWEVFRGFFVPSVHNRFLPTSPFLSKKPIFWYHFWSQIFCAVTDCRDNPAS